VNYTWKDEEAKYNTEHKVDPSINPYTGKPYGPPKPKGYYQEILLRMENPSLEEDEAEDRKLPESEKPYRMLTDVDAVRIGGLCRKSRESMEDSMRYAIEAGHHLIAKKDSLAHGEWLPWLEANADTLGFDTRRTASRLMKLANEYGSPNGTLASHLNDADIVQINRQIWGHTKTPKAPATKPKVEAIPPPASKMDIDLSFLSVNDRRRVEEIIHRVEQQSNDQIKALAKENADLRTRIQELKQEYKQCINDLLKDLGHGT
jgi:hypothetical protein